jgi:hypothetical protein
MPFRFSGAITRSVTTDGLSLCRAGLTRPRQCRYAARMISSCDFRFLCPMKWDEMADLPDGSGKHCAHCQRSVVTVHTRKEFDAAARRGDCVAVFPEGEEELPRLTGVPEEPEFPPSSRLTDGMT